MDNGCSSHQKRWRNFQWSPVAGASLYQNMLSDRMPEILVNTAVASKPIVTWARLCRRSQPNRLDLEGAGAGQWSVGNLERVA
jgi:hypothetical protein